MSSARPLNVAIIGAGIGGLTAAIELRHNGHHVTLYERSRFANEYGAAIHVAPNANGLLLRLGIDLGDDGAVPTETICEGNKHAEILKRIPIGRSKGMWQNGWYFCNRSTLHNRLKREALKEGGKGAPVKLLTSTEITHLDPRGTLTTKDGISYQADVIVGADGAHSRTRKFLFGSQDIGPTSKGSGKNAYRFMVRKEALGLEAPDTFELFRDDGELISFYDLDRRVVVYPADHNEWLNVVCPHPEGLSDGSSEDWNRKGDKQRLLEIYKEFSPKIQALLGQAKEESLNVWKLVDMEPLHVWTRDRLCLLGDAAHPFLPYNGQGASCAMEDAASLGVMLPIGTLVDEIPERLKLYQEARKSRANELQEYSRVAGHDLEPGAMDMVGKSMAKLSAFAYGHDEHHHSTQILREHIQQKVEGGLIWRSPVGFGPMPGPRQRFDGSAYDASQSPYTSVAIKMRTSKTLLQNILPRRDVLSFFGPGTVADVTWKFQRNDAVAWLGGGQYCHFSFYIHGVQCKISDGSVVAGDFLAFMMEDRADPITTGRDEIGFPKVYCNIEWSEGLPRTETSIKADWEGFEFAEARIETCEPKATTKGVTSKNPVNQAWGASLPPHSGILVHRYVPSVGQRNMADADYICCVPPPEGKDKPTVEETWTSNDARISFSRGDWQKLPTLHHIVDRIAELPNLGIQEATITKGKGVSDHKGIYHVF